MLSDCIFYFITIQSQPLLRILIGEVFLLFVFLVLFCFLRKEIVNAFYWKLACTTVLGFKKLPGRYFLKFEPTRTE